MELNPDLKSVTLSEFNTCTLSLIKTFLLQEVSQSQEMRGRLKTKGKLAEVQSGKTIMIVLHLIKVKMKQKYLGK